MDLVWHVSKRTKLNSETGKLIKYCDWLCVDERYAICGGQVFTVVCRPALGTIQHPKQRSRSSRGVELRGPMQSSAQWAPGNLLRVDKAAEV